MARTGNITIAQGAQNVAANTSSITVVGTITTTNGSYRGSHRSGVATVKQGSKTIYSEAFTSGADADATTTLFTIELVVEHDSEGKSEVITASYDYDDGWCTATAYLELEPIPRSSTLTLENGTLGTAQGYTISRQDTGFRHKIRYICGSLSGYILGTASTTSTLIQDLSWAPPLNWATQNTSGKSVTAEITLETYSGSTLIGSNKYPRTFAIPASVIPTVFMTVTDPTGYFGLYESYIKGKSQFRVQLSATGAQGSTIEAYKISINGKVYTESDITTDLIDSPGECKITAVVTDSRKRSSEIVTETITVADYSPPKVYDVSVFRSNSDGKPDPTGAYLCAKFSAEISSINGVNSATYEVRYKKKTASYWNTKTLTEYTESYLIEDAICAFAADTDVTYDVAAVARDDFTETAITKDGPTISIHRSKYLHGRGIAFGKIAELIDTFDVAWKAIFRKDATVYDSEGTGHVVGEQLKSILAKFASYLPLTGGTVTGEIVASSTNLAATRTVSNVVKKLQLLIESTSGNARLRILNGGIQKNYVDLTDTAFKFSSNVELPEDKYLHLGTGHITQDANQALKFAASNETDYRLFFGVSASTWCLCPTISGNLSLGNSSVKWKQLFATTSTISTSDRNEKLDITDLDKDLSSAFILALPMRSFKKIDGDSGRTHWGMVSQEVWEVMQSLGISDMDFAGYIRYHKCHPEERERIVVDKETGEEITQIYTEEVYEYDEYGNPVYGYGLRYEEFIAPMIATIQRQAEDINELKRQVEKLRSML